MVRATNEDIIEATVYQARLLGLLPQKSKRKYIYGLNDWRKIRRTILERDDNTCQDCGSNENLHVHHLIPIKEFMRRANHPDNLITVCNRCHRRIEPNALRGS